MPDTDWLDEHIELYAVDVLAPDEHDRVQAELADLTVTERQVYENRIIETQAVMADFASSYAIDAPDTLRERVLEHVFATDDASAVVDLDRARSRRGRRRAALIAAAAAAIVVALGAGVLIGRGTAPEPSTPPVAESGRVVLDVLAAPDAKLSAGQLADNRGAMSVVTSRQRNQAVALLRDIGNPIPDDRDYQLWLIGKADSPVSAGLIPPSGGESPTVVDAIDASTVLAVTVEPKGGSVQPTTSILAQLPL
ncbi:anti-sigma factor [Gordonia sp. CPCC 206044]|uniref:anti-sigma factor n=1 Tax=Gordonia sp. CPCC 206044 TaxID=3140793 RepID=UPI003AF37C4E